MPSTCAPGVQVTEVRGGNLHVDLADRLEDIGGVEFHTGALDAGRGDTHMGLAGAAEDGLAGRLPVVYCRGWVLDDEPVQRSRQPVLIGLLHGGDRHAVHRERERRYDDRHRHATVSPVRVSASSVTAATLSTRVCEAPDSDNMLCNRSFEPIVN